MGHVYVNAEIFGRKRKKLPRILVDTGATYTVVEYRIVEGIGAVKLNGKMWIELGDGRRVKADIYAVKIKIGNRIAPCIVVSFPGAKNVLGVEALESLGLNVDLKRKKLVKSRPGGVAYFY